MSHRRNLCRLVLATLAAASVAAPAASAIPVDPTGPAAAFDARGESAAGGGPTSRPLNHGPFPGPPTWPEDPAPLPPRTAPVRAGDGADGGVDLPVVLLSIAGTLAIGGGMAVAASRVGTRTAH